MIRLYLMLIAVTGILPLTASPLHDMVRRGNHKGLTQVVALKRFDLNEIIKGNTPLTLAASKNDTVAVAILVNAGADVSVENRRGEPPMQAAAAVGAKNVVRWLLKSGCKVISGTNKCGYSTLHFVARRGWNDLIAPLVIAGADPNSKTCEDVTPLDAALFSGSRKTYDILREAGADPTKSPRLKQTAVELGRTNIIKEQICNPKK